MPLNFLLIFIITCLCVGGQSVPCSLDLLRSLLRSHRRLAFQSHCFTKPHPALPICYRFCLHVKGIDKACVLGSSYLKVLETSWILGTGCTVSLESTGRSTGHMQMHSQKPQILRGDRKIIGDTGTLGMPLLNRKGAEEWDSKGGDTCRNFGALPGRVPTKSCPIIRPPSYEGHRPNPDPHEYKGSRPEVRD